MWKLTRQYVFENIWHFFAVHAHSYSFFLFVWNVRDVSTTNIRLRSATVGKISRIFNRGQNIIVLLASPTCLLWRVHAYTRSALGAHHVTMDQCFSTACYAAIAIFRDFLDRFQPDVLSCHFIVRLHSP